MGILQNSNFEKFVKHLSRKFKLSIVQFYIRCLKRFIQYLSYHDLISQSSTMGLLTTLANILLSRSKGSSRWRRLRYKLKLTVFLLLPESPTSSLTMSGATVAQGRTLSGTAKLFLNRRQMWTQSSLSKTQEEKRNSDSTQLLHFEMAKLLMNAGHMSTQSSVQLVNKN